MSPTTVSKTLQSVTPDNTSNISCTDDNYIVKLEDNLSPTWHNFIIDSNIKNNINKLRNLLIQQGVIREIITETWTFKYIDALNMDSYGVIFYDINQYSIECRLLPNARSVIGCGHNPNKFSLCETCLSHLVDTMIPPINLTKAAFDLVKLSIPTTNPLRIHEILSIFLHAKLHTTIGNQVTVLENHLLYISDNINTLGLLFTIFIIVMAVFMIFKGSY